MRYPFMLSFTRLLFRYSLVALLLVTVHLLLIEHGSTHLRESISHSTTMSKVDKLSEKWLACLTTTNFITLNSTESDLAKTLTSTCRGVKEKTLNAYGGTLNIISRITSSLRSLSSEMYFNVRKSSEYLTRGLHSQE